MRRAIWPILALSAAACADGPDLGSQARSPEVPAPNGPTASTVEPEPGSARVGSSAGSATLATAPPLPDGSASPTTAAAPDLPRVHSVGYVTWIRKAPRVREGDFLGYVRVGGVVPLRSKELVNGTDCPGGYYQVAPHGYVCRDRTVTEEPNPVFWGATQATRGGPGPLPYKYVIANGSPVYNRVPTAAEQQRFERFLGKPGSYDPLPLTLRSHEELAIDTPIAKNSEVPSFFEPGQSPRAYPYDLVEQTVFRGSMLAYIKSFEAEGRTWLLATDHTLVPADRVRTFRASSFRGVDLAKGEAKLPIAFMRKDAKPVFVRDDDGAMKDSGETFGVRTFVELDATRVESGGVSYLETKRRLGEKRTFLREKDATVVDVESAEAAKVGEKQKWFLIRISQGTMVAYEGKTPVYATLVSPGVGGIPVKGRDPVKDSTTPLGTYTITFKDRAATMSPEKGKNRAFFIADVPHTQYFNPPFAIHAAYWHERFGELVSAGCVNLSPIDAERLFGWSDPPVPDGWQGATGAGAKENGPTSLVVVRR